MARSRRLVDLIRELAAIPSGPVVVALSGGADSSVLAWLAADAAESARAVFVDHGLESSGALRAAALRVAEACGLALDVVDAPVDRSSPSFEETARGARYEALLAAAKPDEWILTGHTADDQAETVLGNFLRGAGAAGLSGIPAQRGHIRRPLLAVTREQTREAAVELGLPFFDDPDNQSADLRRNRLRMQLIPQLEAEYNPALRDLLVRTAQVMAADEEALEQAARRIPITDNGEWVAVPAPALAVVDEAVAARAVRAALRTARGPHGGSQDEVAAVLAVAARERRAAELEGGLRVAREGPLVVISGPAPPPLAPVPVESDGQLVFDRWVLSIATAGRSPRPLPLGPRMLVADADAVGADLTVRPPTAEDRVEIEGGSKAVMKALAERGVPERLRRRWPIVTAAGRVAIIPGARVAEWARPGPGTARYLRVQLNPEV